MAEPLDAFATRAEQDLYELRALTERPVQLRRQIDSALAAVGALRTEARKLTGHVRPELIEAMDTKLASVRRAMETFKEKALEGASLPDHEHLIAMNELAEFVAAKLTETAHYFGDEVAIRRDPG
jgi:ABC-type transporter Mla subunit MlaD